MNKLWPADKVERRSVASLVPYAKNARTHSSEQVAQLAQSIKQWGWTTPVLIDEKGMIIAGHGRVLAAQQLSITDIPVMIAIGWTETQKRAYILADNKLAMNAGWDTELLKIEIKELQGEAFNVDLIGFSGAELADILADKTVGLVDPDWVPDKGEDPVSQAGMVWMLGNHRLMCGSSTSPSAVAMLLKGAKPHLMVTDPPYGVDYDPAWRHRVGLNNEDAATGVVMNDDQADWREAWVLFPGDVAYVWHAGLFSATVQQSLEACKFGMRSQIIWAKSRLCISRGHYHWQHEPCWYAVRAGATGHWAGGRKNTTLWDIEHTKSDTGHGTQKPVECMRRPIENNSNAGDAVYEPFSGSGTTLIAAEMTARKCYAMELDPTYVDMAIKRWQIFTGRLATLEGTGQSFDEVARGTSVVETDEGTEGAGPELRSVRDTARRDSPLSESGSKHLGEAHGAGVGSGSHGSKRKGGRRAVQQRSAQ